MARVTIVVFAILCGICLINAYPRGPPRSACTSMRPNHGVSPADLWTQRPYHIDPFCIVLEPDEFMKIKLRQIRPIRDDKEAGKYRGMFMQVRKSESLADGTTVGSFTVNDDPTIAGQNPSEFFQKMRCSRRDDAVSHKSRDLKVASKTEFTWTGPKTCEENEIFYIRATVVRSKGVYQADIVVPVICRADRSNVAVMNIVKPIHPALYCTAIRRGSWAIIPKNANESFEEPNLPSMGGWSHMFSDPARQFKRRMGPTPSAGTGAPSAQHGEYYYYFEATGTQNFDSAGLISPHGMVGCFCFSFWCHMNTDGKTRFRVTLLGQSPKTVSDIVAPTDAWSQVKYNFRISTPTVIAIQVFSSGGDRGDIALDDFRVEAGHCPGAGIQLIVD